LEYETLSGDEIKILMDGGDIHRPEDDDPTVDQGPGSTVPEADGHKKSGPESGGLEPEPQPGS
jgi:cell division protease FtsH